MRHGSIGCCPAAAGFGPLPHPSRAKRDCRGKPNAGRSGLSPGGVWYTHSQCLFVRESHTMQSTHANTYTNKKNVKVTEPSPATPFHLHTDAHKTPLSQPVSGCHPAPYNTDSQKARKNNPAATCCTLSHHTPTPTTLTHHSQSAHHNTLPFRRQTTKSTVGTAISDSLPYTQTYTQKQTTP